MCLYPTLIKNPKYTETKKNGGVIPPINDKRVLAVPIGCGRCIECVKNEARKWQIRLYEECKEKTDGKFITLTFSTESLIKLNKKLRKLDWYKRLKGYEREHRITKEAVKLFLERWRKKNKKSIRHWFITELGHGETEHMHIHGIVWGVKDRKELEKTWSYGYIYPRNEKEWKKAYANERTINYIIKYIKKRDIQHENYKPIILCSSGIGKNYIGSVNNKLNKYKKEETKEYYITKTGHKLSLPIYYRNKTYTEEEREKLWLEKLDKQERYVCGERIDISKGFEEYNKTVKHYREKNKRLGYGEKEKWEEKKYEEQQRTLLFNNRIKGGLRQEDNAPLEGRNKMRGSEKKTDSGASRIPAVREGSAIEKLTEKRDWSKWTGE